MVERQCSRWQRRAFSRRRYGGARRTAGSDCRLEGAGGIAADRAGSRRAHAGGPRMSIAPERLLAYSPGGAGREGGRNRTGRAGRASGRASGKGRAGGLASRGGRADGPGGRAGPGGSGGRAGRAGRWEAKHNHCQARMFQLSHCTCPLPIFCTCWLPSIR